MKIHVNGKLVVITDQTILATNQWFADNAQGCIDEALSGAVFCNDVDEVVKRNEKRKAEYLSGNFDLWLGYYQQAYLSKPGKVCRFCNKGIKNKCIDQ